MEYRPLISVVIPTFNRAAEVQSAVESVLAQTYSNCEVIVIDDGSTDGTGESIQRIIKSQCKAGKKIRYFFQPNQGQSAARNKGTEEANGEWVAFLDSDDVWLPEKLELQVNAINQFKDKCCACITDVRLVDNRGMDKTAFHESGRHYDEMLGLEKESVRNLVKSRDPFWISTLLVRADVIKQVGWFDLNLRYAEDHDFLFRLSLLTSFCHVNKPLCITNRSKSPEGSKCRPWDNVEVRLQGSQSMFEKWLNLETGAKLQPDVRKNIIQSLRNVYSAWTNWFLQHERYEEARQAIDKAIQYQLTTRLAVKWSLTHFAPSLARRISPRMRVH